VYDLVIPVSPAYSNAKPLYSVDNHQQVSGFTRIAYYLELDNEYVWVSFDAFTADASKIGVPCHNLGCGDGQTRTVIQQMVTNVNVESNVDGLSGTGLSGNVEVSLLMLFRYILRLSFFTPVLSNSSDIRRLSF